MSSLIAKGFFRWCLASFFVCAFLYSIFPSHAQAAATVEAEGAPAGFDKTFQPATMDWDAANRLCTERGGALPTVEELQAIADGTGSGVYVTHKWPKGMFWSSVVGAEGPVVVFMGNGKALGFPASSLQWVTCTKADIK